MESFIVYNPAGSVDEHYFSDRNVYANPTNKEWNISGSWNGKNSAIELRFVGEKCTQKHGLMFQSKQF